MFLAHLIGVIEGAQRTIEYRWRRLVSMLIATRFAQAEGHVFIGSDCIVTGHRCIHLKGSFVALGRNRIEAITSHHRQAFSPSIVIGDGVSMEYDCHIAAINRIEIGRHVLMASRVYISDHSHGGTAAIDLAAPPNQRPVVSKGPVIIEDEVWLGEGVAVMPNVRIGRSSIIGANSVVTRDIPPYCVAVGVPARVVRTLGPCP